MSKKVSYRQGSFSDDLKDGLKIITQHAENYHANVAIRSMKCTKHTKDNFKAFENETFVMYSKKTNGVKSSPLFPNKDINVIMTLFLQCLA